MQDVIITISAIACSWMFPGNKLDIIIIVLIRIDVNVSGRLEECALQAYGRPTFMPRATASSYKKIVWQYGQQSFACLYDIVLDHLAAGKGKRFEQPQPCILTLLHRVAIMPPLRQATLQVVHVLIASLHASNEDQDPSRL